MTPVNNDLKKAIKAEEHIVLGLAGVLAGIPSDEEIQSREVATLEDTITGRNHLHKYRCETCKNPDCPFGVEAKYCVRIILNIMHKVGCASHSDATKAEQRIKDVIIALEKEISALEGREPKLGTRMEYEMIGRCNSKADGVKYALALLRGEGE